MADHIVNRPSSHEMPHAAHSPAATLLAEEFLPQPELLNLPRRRLRKLLHEPPDARCLISRQMLATVREEFLLRRCLTCHWPHERRNDLAPVPVWNPHHRHIAHPGMRE